MLAHIIVLIRSPFTIACVGELPLRVGPNRCQGNTTGHWLVGGRPEPFNFPKQICSIVIMSSCRLDR